MSALTRFYSPRPLDEDELFRLAPSIFNREAHPSRTDRFSPIATIDAVRALAQEGFLPFGASESRTRLEGQRPYIKHMLKFRKLDAQPMTRVGDAVLETILTNANNGRGAYHVDAGIFKLACLNGMVIKSDDFGSLTVRHSGDAIVKVLEGTHALAQNAGKIMDAPRRWAGIQLDRDQMHAFALQAHHLRWPHGEERITPTQLLIVRREQDIGNDLWRVFNRIQENVVEGGLSAARHETTNRAWTTRRVRGIDSNVRLNKELWGLAESYSGE